MNGFDPPPAASRGRIPCLVAFVLASTLALAQAPAPQSDLRALLRSGDTAALSAWLDKDPSALRRPDAQGLQPIHWAAFFGDRTVLELLVARGADPCASGPLGTPLHGAAMRDQVETVRWLAAQGVDPNVQATEILPPLVIAVRRGSLPTIVALLEVGASPQLTDPMGNSPLLLAASAGLEPAVRLLLAGGADADQGNVRGQTPLDVARREAHGAIVALLEARGAKGNPAAPPPSGPYLGQEPPGTTPRRFAPDFVSTEKRELNAAFSPDGRELYFSRDRVPSGTAILVTRREGERWTPPVVAPFSAGAASDVDVFVSPDGRRAYFCSNRPAPAARGGGEPVTAGAANSDIWTASRTGGRWDEPTPLGGTINSDADDYYPTLARDGTLYFSSNRPGGLGANDVYRSCRDERGRWTTPENLGAPVNSSGREFDPLIAPDQSWLVFASERPGGYGAADLYVSFRKADGSWEEPKNLDPPINTGDSEYTPMLSPDGRYLFFTRGRLGCDDIYWVEAKGLGLFAQASGALDSTTVPFTLDHNRMIVEVEFVRPDGTARKARAWVDTGSQFLELEEPLARDLGLDVSGLKPGDAHEMVASSSPAPAMRLGGLPLHTEGIAVKVSPGKGLLPGVPAEATLPASALRSDHVVFDYPARRLTIARPGTLKPRGVALPCRVNTQTGLFLVSAMLDGETVQVGVDNGSAGTWVSDALTAAWQARHPAWPHAVGAAGSANFFGFPFEAKGTLMRLPELDLGTLRARDVAVLGLPQGLFDWYSGKSAGPVAGFIGANVLQGFRLEVDFPNGMTYWEAGPPPGTGDLDIVGLTIRPEDDGSFTVAGVVTVDGKPAVAGVQAGDKLVRVGSLDASGALMGTVVDALRGRPGESRTLVVAREGKRLTVEAAVMHLP